MTVICRTAFWNTRQAVRYDDSTDGTELDHVMFYSCSCAVNNVRGMKTLAHSPLHEHSISFSRDGFIQGLGRGLMKILTKHIMQITRQL